MEGESIKSLDRSGVLQEKVGRGEHAARNNRFDADFDTKDP